MKRYIDSQWLINNIFEMETKDLLLAVIRAEAPQILISEAVLADQAHELVELWRDPDNPVGSVAVMPHYGGET